MIASKLAILALLPSQGYAVPLSLPNALLWALS
jgi:hypothetical protein